MLQSGERGGLIIIGYNRRYAMLQSGERGGLP